MYCLYIGAEFERSLNGDQSCHKGIVLGTQGLGLGFNLCVPPLPVKLMSQNFGVGLEIMSASQRLDKRQESERGNRNNEQRMLT